MVIIWLIARQESGLDSTSYLLEFVCVDVVRVFAIAAGLERRISIKKGFCPRGEVVCSDCKGQH